MFGLETYQRLREWSLRVSPQDPLYRELVAAMDNLWDQLGAADQAKIAQQSEQVNEWMMVS